MVSKVKKKNVLPRNSRCPVDLWNMDLGVSAVSCCPWDLSCDLSPSSPFLRPGAGPLMAPPVRQFERRCTTSSIEPKTHTIKIHYALQSPAIKIIRLMGKNGVEVITPQNFISDMFHKDKNGIKIGLER